MARVMVKATGGVAALHGVVVVLVRVDGIWAIGCNGDMVGHGCPGDIETGDTWTDLGSCMADAIKHVESHERRREA